MSFFWKISAVLISVGAIALSPGVIMAQLSSESACTRAEGFTVLIRGANSTGSGILYQRQGNTYSVITNYHVVKDPGSYEIQIGNKRYEVESAKRARGLDLAMLQFSSSQNYSVARLNNSPLSVGQEVYAAGYPGNQPVLETYNYRCVPGQINSLLDRGYDGYTMEYSNEAVSGMSGGPVLDTEGRVVGVNGRVEDINLARLRLSIPITTFLSASLQPMTLQASNLPSQQPPTQPQQIPSYPPGILPPGSVVPHPGKTLNLSSEVEDKILRYLNYNNLEPVPCDTFGAIRNHSIEGVSGYTVCYRSASN
ncbi:MAG: trypsin-like peptidase domain-containing protein [Okeania sp. SIO2H7]|nr:trypsin-like peptidase domain-containing protein [Okeania sp. SIO2H7]